MIELSSCPHSTLISQALLLLHKSPFHCLFVLDDNKLLIGVMTDGDFRRGLLNGVEISEAVIKIMNTNYVAAYSMDEAIHFDQTHKFPGVRVFPIVKNGSLVDIYCNEATESDPSTALILAGGFGSRMGELTAQTPKPMLPLLGKPLLEYQISRLVSQGIRNITLAVHYKASIIKEYFGDGSAFNCEIKYVEERTPLGTGGALGFFDPKGNNSFLVMNADVLCDLDLSLLHKFHLAKEAVGTMVLKMHRITNPYGCVDLENDNILGITEKPVYQSFVNTGVYFLSREAIQYVEPNTRVDMPELFELLRRDNRKCVGYPITETWLDVGTPDAIYKAEQFIEKWTLD